MKTTFKKFIRKIKCAINLHEFKRLGSNYEFCKHCLEMKTKKR